MGFLFVGMALPFDMNMEWVLMLFFVCILCLISWIDIRVQKIPNRYLFVAVVVRILFYVLTEPFHWRSFLTFVGNGLCISLPLLLLVLFIERIWKKEAMGGGDIKLLFVTGMYLGWEKNLLALFFASIAGLVYNMLQRKEENKQKAFPFGPFIAAGTVISMLIGDRLLR